MFVTLPDWSPTRLVACPIWQLLVAAYLYLIGEPVFAAVLFGLVLPQMFSQISFLQACPPQPALTPCCRACPPPAQPPC